MEGAQGPRHFRRCGRSSPTSSTCGMSAKLAELGYEIETKFKPDRHGGMEYHTWDIKAASGHEAGWKSINDKIQPPAPGNRGQGKADRRGDEGKADDPGRARSAVGGRARQARRHHAAGQGRGH